LLPSAAIRSCRWMTVFDALQPTIPHLTRSSLHRCLQRHGISRLPDVEGDKPARKRFKRYPIGYFHIDLAEVRIADGKLYLFVAIDRTSKFAFARLVEKAGKMAAAQFLRDLVAAVPYRLHTVLTDNGIQFSNRKCDTHAFEHIFDRVCREYGIEHRLTKVKHPWSLRDQDLIRGIKSPENGQVERMNRTIKDATVKRFHYDSHEQLRSHLQDFLDAYNFARRLKTLSGLTPYEFICKSWTSEPEKFILNPIHQMPGLNT
jgi:transposase InsO family protein